MTFWDKVYDSINIIITILDLVTDILVIYDFWCKNRFVFFILAVSCVVIAHVCYTLVFVLKYSSSYDTSNEVIAFICLLPFSPLMPYILYFSSLPNNCFSNVIFPIFGFKKDEWHAPSEREILNHDISYNYSNYSAVISSESDDNKIFVNVNETQRGNSPKNEKNSAKKAKHTNMDSFVRDGIASEEWKDWAKQKIITNIGFIIEGMIQSFPEAIIQVVAIVYYKEYNNYISLVSILLSLLSVCVKSLILTQGINHTLRFFKWAAAVTDFFAIFVMVSWAFYSIDDASITSRMFFSACIENDVILTIA